MNEKHEIISGITQKNGNNKNESRESNQKATKEITHQLAIKPGG